MATVLRNNTGRKQTFELPHDVVCTDTACLCTVLEHRSRTLNPDSGDYGERVEVVRAPYAVRLPARGQSGPLPDAVAEVPSVAEAVKHGLISID